MSDRDALLAAVLAAPDDDAPRLIYADWLDDHGQPERAAFIRLQIELARLPEFDPHRLVLARRADRLFDRHGADWRAELPQLRGITWGEFARGFCRSVRARTLGFFERAAAGIWAAAPIDTLEISGPDAHARLAGPRAYAALRRLRIRHLGLVGGRADEFFHSRLLDTIESLDLTGLGLGNEGVAAFARAARFERLRELILDQNGIGSGGIETLSHLHGLRRLTRLSIRGEAGYLEDDDPVVRGDAVEAVAGSHVFGSLEALDLSFNELDDESLAHIVQSTHLTNLRELNLSGNALSAGALEILEDEGWEVRFESLDLSRNPIGDRGARRLAESEVCNELVRLVLDRCDLGPEGAEAIAGADWFPALRSLSLNDNAIGPGVRAIAANGASLAELRLRNNEMGSAAPRAIAASPAMAGLEILDLSANLIGAGGVRTLGSAAPLKKLAILDLGYNELPQEAGLLEPAVAALGSLASSLIVLRLDGNRLGAPGVLGLVTNAEWPELTELAVRSCGLNLPALAYLARDGRFPALTRLAVGSNFMDANGLKDLLRAPFVAGLSHLDLTNNRVNTDGARLLAAADLPWLRYLSLSGNLLRAPGFNALARSTTLPRLVTVRHMGNSPGAWSPQLDARFPGDEDWPEPPVVYDEEIPF